MTRWAAAVCVLVLGAACSHSTPHSAAYTAGWDYAATGRAQGHPVDCSAGTYTLTVQETGAGTLPDWQAFEHAQDDFLTGCDDALAPRQSSR